MRVRMNGLGVVLFAVLQVACGGKAPPPPADTSTAPPPDMGKALPTPPAGFRIGTQKEYDSLQAAREKRASSADSSHDNRPDSTRL